MALRTDLRRTAALAGLGLALLVGVFGVWATTTSIHGAVLVHGRTAVEGDARQIQSLDGGLVATVVVADGDRVEAGDALLRFDTTQVDARLGVWMRNLAENMALEARLTAEHRGLDEAVFTYDPLPFPAPDMLAQMEEDQRLLFEARAEREARRRQSETQRRARLVARAAGLDEVMKVIDGQLAGLDEDIDRTTDLFGRGLATQQTLSALERERSALLGERARLQAERVQVDEEMQWIAAEARKEDAAHREAVLTELRRARSEIQRLTLEIVSLRDDVRRGVLRAPVSGIVHDLRITGPGSVVAAGAPIMSIVPADGMLEFEMRLAPEDISRVYPGQPALVTFAAIDPRGEKRLKARVVAISPDVVAGDGTGQEHYPVRLGIDAAELDRLGGARLVPGMPVQAWLKTGAYSVMDYLLDPAVEHMRAAFRES